MTEPDFIRERMEGARVSLITKHSGWWPTIGSFFFLTGLVKRTGNETCGSNGIVLISQHLVLTTQFQGHSKVCMKRLSVGPPDFTYRAL